MVVVVVGTVSRGGKVRRLGGGERPRVLMVVTVELEGEGAVVVCLG